MLRGSFESTILLVKDEEIFAGIAFAESGEIGKSMFLIIMDNDDVTSSHIPIIIGLYRDGKKVEIYNSTFIGPNKLE